MRKPIIEKRKPNGEWLEVAIRNYSFTKEEREFLDLGGVVWKDFYKHEFRMIDWQERKSEAEALAYALNQ